MREASQRGTGVAGEISTGDTVAGGESPIRRKHRNRKFIEEGIGISRSTPLFLKNFLIPAEGTNDGSRNFLCMPQLNQTRCRTFLVILGRMVVYSFRKH